MQLDQHMLAILEKTQTHQWMATVGLLVGVLLARWAVLRLIKRSRIKSAELRRRWIVQVRNACFFLVTIGLIVVWAAQLRAAALSIVAVFAAVVLATKELLQCVSGGFLKITSGSFVLGDRICVKDIRGEVIDQTLLATKVLEIGPGQSVHQGTSRAITIPNSVFLTEPVYNESFTDKYVLHAFTVPVAAADDWTWVEHALLEAARDVCKSFVEDARRHIAHLTAREGLDTPSVDPRVTICLPQPDRIDLVVRVPVPVDKKGRVEQEILRRYLSQRAERPQTTGSHAPNPS